MSAEGLQELQHAFVVCAFFARQRPGYGARQVVVPDKHSIRVGERAASNIATRSWADAGQGFEDVATCVGRRDPWDRIDRDHRAVREDPSPDRQATRDPGREFSGRRGARRDSLRSRLVPRACSRHLGPCGPRSAEMDRNAPSDGRRGSGASGRPLARRARRPNSWASSL